MNRPVKTLLRVTGLAVGIGAVIWALKDRLLPSPQIPDEPPPRFRGGTTTSATIEAPPAPGGTLTDIKGIGPVYAGRLEEAGIVTLADLAGAAPSRIADIAGVSAAVATRWTDEAAELS